MLVKELCNLGAPTGFEDAVRDFLIDNSPISDYEIDSIGNLIFHKKGSGRRVMVVAHMDEVGFIITGITEDGFLKFDALGSVESSVMSSKKVLIGKNRIPGIICAKAIHLQSGDEVKKPHKVKNLCIDIGAESKEDAQKHVSLGDYAVFDGEYIPFGDNVIKSKALDDRVGCAVLLELMKNDYDSDLYFVFTVQEEIGVRGAKCVARYINPELALVLEGTTCADISPDKPHRAVTTLGGGCVMTAMDNAAVSDEKYFEFIKKCASENNIPLQIKRTTAGGTDAGAIVQSLSGVKTAVLAVPTRYLHSPVSVAHEKDIESLYKLSDAVLNNIGRSGL